jgi:hypothetical protein
MRQGTWLALKPMGIDGAAARARGEFATPMLGSQSAEYGVCVNHTARRPRSLRGDVTT